MPFPVNAAVKPRILQLRSQLFQLAVLIAVDRHQALLVETHTPVRRLERDRHAHQGCCPASRSDGMASLVVNPRFFVWPSYVRRSGRRAPRLSMSIAEGEPKVWTGWNVCALVESQTTNRDVDAD